MIYTNLSILSVTFCRVSYCRQKCKNLEPTPENLSDSEEEEEEVKDAKRMNTENEERVRFYVNNFRMLS